MQLADAVTQTIVINPPAFPKRRAAAIALCEATQLSNVLFSDGSSGLPHQLACTRAHRKALETIQLWPSLVLEDDLQLSSNASALPPLPSDADIIYLSVTPFGCLPWSRPNLGIARHRALQGLTLASVYNADWLRLHSMSGGQAILYVTEKGRDRWLSATHQAERFGATFDVFTAYAMKDVNVYAPHAPIFSEDSALQRDSLRANQRLLKQRQSFTRIPLMPFVAGATTTVYFKGQKIEVQARPTKNGALEWNVLDVSRDAVSQ